MLVDVAGNRKRKEWSVAEKVGRLSWFFVYPLFRCSPRPFWFWRRFLLRVFGANVGPDVHVYPSVRIAVPWNLQIGAQSAVGDGVRLYSLGCINIGRRVTISQGAHLCAGTHSIDDPTRPLLKLPISIRDDAWVAADAFIGPDVTVGEGAVVGARSVVFRDVMPRTIVVGNPARPTGRTVQ